MGTMQKYSEVIKGGLELARTGQEGLEFTQVCLERGNFAEAIRMLSNVTQAFIQVQESISLFLNDLPANRIGELATLLTQGFDMIINCYEKGEPSRALEIVQVNLLPNYLRWKGELERVLSPYVAS